MISHPIVIKANITTMEIMPFADIRKGIIIEGFSIVRIIPSAIGRTETIIP
jgi:hypothetical protein